METGVPPYAELNVEVEDLEEIAIENGNITRPAVVEPLINIQRAWRVRSEK